MLLKGDIDINISLKSQYHSLMSLKINQLLKFEEMNIFYFLNELTLLKEFYSQ